ncbi:MAG: glycosyltransferase family 39 protein [Desulfobacterales bacterium]|nr:glycosyltransferase family 39 protein [Desulfobacterales bacterium]
MLNKKQIKIIIFSIIPPITLTLFFFIMIYWSWRKWPNILVDFGRELYNPWQINSGRILYKDIAHIFGPFSAYFNAFLFKIFGVSYTVLIVSNIIELALFIVVLYLFLYKITSQLTAYISCVIIIFVFAFSTYFLMEGNYNFISPYCHEATHGIILSLFLIYQLYNFITKRLNYHLILAGLIFGLIFLTKVEIFLAAFAATTFFFILFCNHKTLSPNTGKTIGIFLLASMIPFVSFFLYFCTVMPIQDTVASIFISWKILFNKNITANLFYIRCMGLDNIVYNLTTMFFHTAIAILILGMIYVLNLIYSKNKTNFIIRCVCIICFLVIISLAFFIDPHKIGVSFPVFNFISFLILLTTYLKLPTKNEVDSYRLIILLSWSVFSMVLLFKVWFACTLSFYGFFLTPFSVILLIIMLLWFFPTFDKKLSGDHFFRNGIVMMILIITGNCVIISYDIYKLKIFPVGSDSDRIVCFHPNVDAGRAYYAAKTIEWINSNVGQQETVVVLPEGVIFNYLTKRINPTRFTSVIVPEFILFKEDVILDDFIKHFPDYFVIVHVDTSYYGVGYFGQDFNYGKKMMSWVNQHYETVRLFGREPLREGKGRFGIKIMKKK